MQIDIYYLTSNIDSPVHLSISPETCFGPLEPGETYVDAGYPRYNYTWENIDVPLDKLVWSGLRRTGVRDPTVFSTQYFNDGKVWITHRSDPNGYEELIHSIDFGTRDMILRTFKQPGGRWVGIR